MSIKDFIGTSNVVDKFGSELPIPYIETVNVHDTKVEVQLSMYIELNAEMFATGRSSLDNLANICIQGALSTGVAGDPNRLRVYVMPLFDRNADTNVMGVNQNKPAPENTASPADYGINNWSNVISGNKSPLNCVLGNGDRSTLGATSFGVVTQFIVPEFVPGDAAIGRLKDAFDDAEVADNLFTKDEPVQKVQHIKVNDGYPVDATKPNIRTIASARFHDGLYPDIATAEDTILIRLINEAIQLKKYNTIGTLFGYEEFTKPENTSALTIAPVAKAGGALNYGITAATPFIKNVSTPSYFEFGLDKWTAQEVTVNADGSAKIKLVSPLTKLDKFPMLLFNRNCQVGAKKVGLVSFSTPLDISNTELKKSINESIENKLGNLTFFETAISGYNYVQIVQNDDLSLEPAVIYVDSNGAQYNSADVMRTIDGKYYAIGALKPSEILRDFSAIETLSSTSTSVQQSYQFLLSSTTVNPINMIPEINKYRKAFPDKSSATSAGKFYNDFTEVLHNVNKIIQRGTPVSKALYTNPIVKDYRPYTYGSAMSTNYLYSRSASEIASGLYDIYYLDNGMWARYTEVTGHDAGHDGVLTKEPDPWTATATTAEDRLDSGEITSKKVVTSWDGVGWNYNFIDHVFTFFNYERALKTTSDLSKYFNISYFEKYFGQRILNKKFQMKNMAFHSFYRDSDTETTAQGIGSMCASIHPTNLGSRVTNTEYWGIGALSEGKGLNIDLDMFDTHVENNMDAATEANGYIATGDGETRVGNAFGGADGMTNAIEYSFIAKRGFCPINTQGTAAPLRVESTFIDEEPINYRLGCFEVQKCNAFDSSEIEKNLIYPDEDTGRVAELTNNLNNGCSFKSCFLVKDETWDIFDKLKRMLDKYCDEFDRYLEICKDLCNYNELTGYFNQFFIDAMNTAYPNPTQAPWFRTVVFALILEDIRYGTFRGDFARLTSEIERIIQSISPETGTLAGVEAFEKRLTTLQDALATIETTETVWSSRDADQASGHWYGHDGDHDITADGFETLLGAWQAACSKTTAATHGPTTSPDYDETWVPGVGYDNYPLYPHKHTSTTTTSTYKYNLPDPDDEKTTTDVTEQLLADAYKRKQEDYAITNERLEALRDIINEQANKIDDLVSRLGLDRPMDWLTGWIEDALMNVGSTFPKADEIARGVLPLSEWTYPYGMSPYDVIDNVGDMANLATFLEAGMLDVRDHIASGATDYRTLAGNTISITEGMIESFNMLDVSVGVMAGVMGSETWAQMESYQVTMVANASRYTAYAAAGSAASYAGAAHAGGYFRGGGF